MAAGLMTWCNRLIKSGYYLLFGLVPLLLTPLNYELFEYNKMMAVYALTVVISVAWLVKTIRSRTVLLAHTPLDIPIALFLSSQAISTVFSIDPHISWLGYYSRFNGGLWSVISYILLFYAFLSNLDAFGQMAPNGQHPKAKRSADLPITLPYLLPLLKVSLVTATAVSVYGVLERLGIDKHLWVQDVQNRVFSTLGQPNWLAAYLAALSPIAMAMAMSSLRGTKLRGNPDRIATPPARNDLLRFGLWSTVSSLFFATLLFTKSRSGLLGFAVADVMFWGMMFGSSLRSPAALRSDVNIRPAVFLHLIIVLIVFFVGTSSPAIDSWITWNGLQTKMAKTTEHIQNQATPSAVSSGPALEVGGTESGTIRKYVWQGALNAWNSSLKTKLIGTGTETFTFAFYQFRPVEHNLTSEWDFLYNKAHNEYLNFLTTTGIFGLGSYILFIGSFLLWFAKVHGSWFMVHRKTDTLAVNYELSTMRYALFAGWLSILVTNFFGFSVVITQVFLFVIPAILFALSPSEVKRTTLQKNIPAWLVLAPVLAGLLVLLKIALFWYADTLYAKGYRLIRSGLYGQAVPAIETASQLNPNEPIYHDELSSAYATLAVAAAEGKNATQAAQLATRAIEESSRVIMAHPQNVNFYKTRTKVLYTLSALDAKFNAEAVSALRAAVPLSPNDPKIYYNLAILTAHEGNNDQSIEYLKQAIALKKNYRDAYFALWVFYTELGKTNDAKDILTEYLTNVDPNDKDFQERLQ